MALLTKAQFADKIGRPSNFLSVYITRKEVVIHSGEGKKALIDDEHPVNFAFLVKKGAQELTKKPETIEKTTDSTVYNAVVVEESSEKKDKKKVPSNGKDANEVYMKNLALIQEEKERTGLQKQQAELEKINLYNQKMRGELLPIALFRPLLARNNQNLTTTFKNTAEELISNMAKKKDFSLEERAELSAQLFSGINKAITDAHDMTVQNLDTIIDDYKESIK
jgi:hypothetical protein